MSIIPKIKIFIPHRNCLELPLLQKEFEIVNSTKEADVVIAQSTLSDDFDGNFSKVIYIAVEPPLADHRLFCYSNFDKFPLVVRHNPNPEKRNQIPFTDTDEAQYFPCLGNPESIPIYIREDTTIKNRGVFYAGMVGPYEMQPDAFGGINLTGLRRKLGEFLIKEIPNSKVMGIGWSNQTKVESGTNWRLDKSNQIKESDCDFVLALENTLLPNYLYEKIWDGFASDRVTLYLGDPRVEHHIPTNCFVDLRKYFNPETKEFDFQGLKDRLMNMTQEEYDKILFNARIFRESADDKHQILKDRLTIKLINIIKSNSERFIKGNNLV
jgi:hypothetical protein